MTHRVGRVRAASPLGAGGSHSSSLTRNTPIAAALLAQSSGSWQCHQRVRTLLPAAVLGIQCSTCCPCGRAGHVLGRADAALAFLGCVVSDGRWERGAALRPRASAGRACGTSPLPAGLTARPRCWRGPHRATCIPLPHWSLPLSPSPGSGSSVQQPSRSAAWPCPWSSRRGTKDGSGVAPWHRTCAGSCLSAAKGLPWGSADPFPWTRSCRNTDAFSARGAGFPS